MKSLFNTLFIYDRAHKHCQLYKLDKELEQLIGTNVIWSYNYAILIIRGRFKFGEKVITTNENYNTLYQKFLKHL